jgi:antitoxin component of MazEF toxin-antitoxin module
MRVAKWGNSLAVRLPQAVVEALGLREGDDIEITVTDARSFRVARDQSRKQALARLRKYRDRLPAGSVALGKKAVDFREVREILSILRAVCTVKPLDLETHELGLDVAERYRFSIYDSMIIAAALKARCSILYTEDLSSGQRIEALTVCDPFTPRP